MRVPALRFVFAALVATSAYAQPAREITPIAGGLYRLQENGQVTVFLVTPDEILVADPLTMGAGRWLRGELGSRFPKRPVRVVYTSHVFERVAGAAAFKDASGIAGPWMFNSRLRRAALSLPVSVAPLDRNGNGRLEQNEWSTDDVGRELAPSDSNKDGVITASELAAAIPFARATFRDGTMLPVGLVDVEVINPGDEGTPALFFPNERVVYSANHPAVLSANFSVGDENPRHVAAWVRRIAALPFETIVTGRGEIVTRAEFTVVVAYVDALYAAAIEAYGDGAFSRDVDSLLPLQKYAGTPRDAHRRTSVAAILNSLRAMRTEVYGTGLIRWNSRNAEYCSVYDSCVSGGRLAGGSGGVRIVRSRVGMLGEVSLGEQSVSHRGSELYDDAFAHRRSRGSLLLRYGPSRPAVRSYDLLAGPTLIVADTRGIERVKLGLAPFAGRRAFAERSTALGFTAGINLTSPITSSVAIVVPFRLTFASSSHLERWPGQLEVEGGIGFSFRVLQRVW